MQTTTVCGRKRVVIKLQVWRMEASPAAPRLPSFLNRSQSLPCMQAKRILQHHASPRSPFRSCPYARQPTHPPISSTSMSSVAVPDRSRLSRFSQLATSQPMLPRSSQPAKLQAYWTGRLVVGKQVRWMKL